MCEVVLDAKKKNASEKPKKNDTEGGDNTFYEGFP